MIKNIEQRRVVIEAVGADVIVNAKNAEHGKISEHGNQLIRLVGLLNKENTPDLPAADDFFGLFGARKPCVFSPPQVVF